MEKNNYQLLQLITQQMAIKCEITVDGNQHKNAGTYEATATKSKVNQKL